MHSCKRSPFDPGAEAASPRHPAPPAPHKGVTPFSANAWMLNSLPLEILGFLTGCAGNLLSATVQLLPLSHHSSFPPPTHPPLLLLLTGTAKTTLFFILIKAQNFYRVRQLLQGSLIALCPHVPFKKKNPPTTTSQQFLCALSSSFYPHIFYFPRLLSFIFAYIFQVMEIAAIDHCHLIAPLPLCQCQPGIKPVTHCYDFSSTSLPAVAALIGPLFPDSVAQTVLCWAFVPCR